MTILLRENNIISRNKIIYIHLISLAVIVVFILTVYFGMSVYYLDRFSLNTWINGYYCTGLTADEALSLIESGDASPTVTVLLSDGTEHSLDMSDVPYTYDYGTLISDLLNSQNSFGWVSGLDKKNEFTVSPQLNVEKDDLINAFYSLDFVKEEIERTPDYILYYSYSEGKYCYTDNLSDRLDYKNAAKDLYDSVMGGSNEFYLDHSVYYTDYYPNEEQSYLINLYSEIDNYQNCGLVYDMGAEEIYFTPELALSFLLYNDNYPIIDADGNFKLDEEKIFNWVDTLCEKYDTLDKVRSFQSTRGDIIEVQPGNYGTLLNKDAEKEYLVQNLLSDELHNGTEVRHIPEYIVSAFSRGVNDIGDTYIEADLTLQHMYYYVDGELVLDTDMVSGDIKTGNGTEEGCFYIENKEEGRYVLGYNFTSFANYWLPFSDDCGINDSNWRDEYGGDIYLTSGSHGTLNVPLEFAQTLYNLVEIGTPVVVFN